MGIIFLALILIGIGLIISYNRIIRLKNNANSSFSTVDVYLKQRYDMIPNLVNVVKGYMRYEKETLEAIISLRNQIVSGGFETAVAKDGEVSAKLNKILALAENYPELKASEQFTRLQTAITETEANIAAGRRAYNASVTDYNNAIQAAPMCIFAKALGFKSMPWFSAAEAERAPVSIEL